jgi:hypothetical protein
MPKDEIVAWVLERHRHQRGHMNQGAVNINDQEQRKLLDATGFPAWIKAMWPGERLEPDRFWTGYWDRECKPGNEDAHGGGWTSGFPHRHGWPHGFTVAMMIQAPLRGSGASVLVPDDGPPIEFAPREGIGVVIEGEVNHGVKAVHGDVPRIVLIATIFPKEG